MADLSFLGNHDVDVLASEFYSAGTIIPPGWYKVHIIKEEIKDTSTGGKMLVFDYQLDSGETIKDRFNLVNQSEKAVNIAKSTLAKIIQSIGIKGGFPKDTNILFGRPFEIKVIQGSFKDKDTGEDRPKNEIKDYRPCQNIQPKTETSFSGW